MAWSSARRTLAAVGQRHYSARAVDAVMTIAWLGVGTKVLTAVSGWSTETASFALALPLVPLSLYWLWFALPD